MEPLALADLDELHAVFSDPETWRHLPSGVHTDVSQTVAMLERMVWSWSSAGLGPWAVRDTSGAFLGMGGVNRMRVGRAWNLGFRLAPSCWGRGVGTLVARAGVEAAQRVMPDLPVTARVLVANPASQRVVERAGLSVIWEGEAGNGLERRVFADREIDPSLLDALVQLG